MWWSAWVVELMLATAAGVGTVGVSVVVVSWCEGAEAIATEVCDWAGGWTYVSEVRGALAEPGVVRAYGAWGNLTALPVCNVGSGSAFIDHVDVTACDMMIGWELFEVAWWRECSDEPPSRSLNGGFGVCALA